MAIDVLRVIVWHGQRAERNDVADPDWAQIEAAIRALDEGARNDLYLQPAAGTETPWLCVGGGGGRYVVSVTTDGGGSHGLLRTDEDDGTTATLVVGGQLSEFTSNRIIDLDTALKAARAFYASGTFDGSGMTWA